MQAVFDALRALNLEDIEARRVFHGRGHCYPGLEAINVDFYSPLLLVTLYQPVGAADLARLHSLAVQLGVAALAVQHRYQQGAPTDVLYGALPEKLQISEAGLNYQIYPGQQQNLGFFLDMAAGREWLRQEAEGANVLNLFAYTCAFSVAAMAGGARQVVNLDMSSTALARGRDNHRLNQDDLSAVKFLAHDLFKSFGRLKRLGPYERIVVDPPSFQRGSFVASKDYTRVLRRLPELVTPNGKVLLCLNDPNIETGFLSQLMAEHCPQAVLERRVEAPVSFPEIDPDKGLKTLVYRFQEH